MTFLSPAYSFFLPLVALIVRLVPASMRVWVLLIASVGFYALIDLRGLLWFFGIVSFSYAAVRSNNVLSRFRFSVSIIIVVAPLLLFKLWSVIFFSDVLEDSIVALSAGLVPLGASFYTLRAISYMVDVRRGVVIPETHAGRYALYLGFFPQLLAGPVERAKHMLDQLKELPTIVPWDLLCSMQLICWGIFKKVVIADRIALIMEDMWQSPGNYRGWAVLCESLLSYIRIYADYSGYIDIAAGSALLLGIRFSDSFRMPYLALSVRDFWRRWNITVSSWFRDYIYIPLGGSRNGTPRWMFSVLVTFLLSGLWHGNSWTFVLWGFLHGLWILLEAGILADYRRVKWPQWMKYPSAFAAWTITLMFTSVTFLLFQAPSIFHWKAALQRMWPLGPGQMTIFATWWKTDLMIVALATILIIIIDTQTVLSVTAHKPARTFARYLWIGALMFTLLNVGIFSEQEFIYFRF